MKKFNYLFSLLVLASSLLLTACDNEDKTIEIVFPESQTTSNKIGETGEISFNAQASWRLTSSATWLVLLDETTETDQIFGEAGQHTVSYLVKGDGADFATSHKAKISLTMNGMTQEICEVTREPLAYTLTAVDQDGNAITAENPFQLVYGAAASIKITGNYTYRVTAPNWIEITSATVGEANTELVFTARVESDFAFEANAGVLTVSNSTFDAAATFELPVAYDGLPANEIAFSINPWNWEVKADGSQFFKTNIDGITEYFASPLVINVNARNNDFTIVRIEENAEWGCTVLNRWNAWFYADDMGAGVVEIATQENSGAARRGIAMVFPTAYYAEIEADFDNNVFDVEDDYYTIKPSMEKYIAVDFQQHATESSAPFTVTSFGQTLELFSLADQAGEDAVIDMYGTKDVYILSLEKMAYEQLTISFSNVTMGQPVYPDTFINGVNTGWEGIEFENSWTSEYNSQINIYGIQANSGENGSMTIQLFNGATDELVGFIVVEQW